MNNTRVKHFSVKISQFLCINSLLGADHGAWAVVSYKLREWTVNWSAWAMRGKFKCYGAQTEGKPNLMGRIENIVFLKTWPRRRRRRFLPIQIHRFWNRGKGEIAFYYPKLGVEYIKCPHSLSPPLKKSITNFINYKNFNFNE